MKKAMSRFLILCVLFTAWQSFSDLIYWQLGEKDPTAGKYTYAQFAKVSGGKVAYLTLVDEQGTPLGQFAEAGGTAKNFWATSGDKPFSSSDSFRIETYNDNDELVGWSWTLSYNDLQKFIKTDAMTVVTTAWAPTIMPEPSSGLLVLMGGALLALRRRRRA